jgi:hypothetical protein
MIRTARAGLVLAALLPTAVACSTPASAHSCGALADCQKFAVRHLGHPVLVPQGAVYSQGADKRGVLGLLFVDPPSGRRFSMFVGRPGKKPATCPGTVTTTLSGRSFCLGQSKSTVLAQFVNAGLLYTVAADSPAGTAPAGNDQQLVTRIVGEIQ